MTDLTKDEILAMAREAGAVFDPQWGIASNTGTATFERFATLCRAPLVAENERLEAEAEAGVFAHGRDMDWLRAERDAAIERADELGADKGTYFRLYEQACIQMTEKDKYGEHYRTLFNNADEANNRLIDERDALRAELGQYPEIQAMLMSENKQLRAEVEPVPKDWRDAVQEFVTRCESGEVRSKKTYAKFVELLSTPPQPAAQEPDCATTGVCVRSGLYASPPSAVPVVEQLVEASTMLLSYTLACEGLLNAKPAGQIDIAQEAIAAGQKFIKENGK